MELWESYVNIDQAEIIKNLTRARVANLKLFKDPCEIILDEQNFISKDLLFNIAKKVYNMPLELPSLTNISSDVINYYDGSNIVPYCIDSATGKLHVMVLPEEKDMNIKPYKNYILVRHIVPIYHFIKAYALCYKKTPEYIVPLSAKDNFELLVEEGIRLGASDLHIVPARHNSEIFYKVRKKKVYSKRSISKTDIPAIISYIADTAKATFDPNDTRPKYMAISLDMHHRGRVVLNQLSYGRKATIRFLSNDIFGNNPDDLNIEKATVAFMRKYYENDEPGLRLIVGPTSSGKNTTMAAVIHEKNINNEYVITSIESPIEIFMEHVEQIQADTEEDYVANAESLIRSDPDIIYLSEFTASSAKSIMRVVNTSKPVYSSIHANSIADIISRIQDLTELSYDRIIEQMHSVVFQQLVRNDSEDKLYPKTHFMYFTPEFKKKLYGKPYGEMIMLLDNEEEKWKKYKDVGIEF